jgi:Asp-tRNA(Asn)/Glu-tRNA(Gln) amidotransferase A subunit family amidase
MVRKNMINNYHSLKKEIFEAQGSKDKIFLGYETFINNFINLDKKYKFSENFDINNIYKQIENVMESKPKSLDYIPFGVKDIFNTKNMPTEMGSELWKGFKAGNNARIVDEIIYRGGVSFCKTTTAEFAVDYIDNSRTLNPHNIKHITGTSSSGSAVAVACGALPICLATQTAGSIIRPSSFCGVFGFKPSFGAFDRTGVLKTTDTLDTIGFIAHSLDLILLAFIKLYQSTTDYPLAQKYRKNYSNNIDKKPNILLLGEQLKIYGEYENYVRNDYESISLELASKFNVIQVKDNDLDFMNNVHESHRIIYDKTLSYYFLEEASFFSKVSDVMQDMIKRGNQYSNIDYTDQLNKQVELTSRMNNMMKKYDIDYIITPSTGSSAPEIGKQEIDDSALIWTYFGMPSVSIPIFKNKELALPFGLQIVSSKYNDLLLLDFSRKLYLLLK